MWAVMRVILSKGLAISYDDYDELHTKIGVVSIPLASETNLQKSMLAVT